MSVIDYSVIDSYICAYIDYDCDVIIDFYHKELPSLFDGIETTMKLSTALTNDTNIFNRFFQVFPEESDLFVHMNNLIHKKTSVAYYINIFPYLDEYINDIFTFKMQ
jgi:hypothetical protein